MIGNSRWGAVWLSARKRLAPLLVAIKDPRVRLRATYAGVFTLGVVFSVLILVYSTDVQNVSNRLVHDDLPLLRQIAALKVEIAHQEAVLYEYYGTGERERFEREFESSRQKSLNLIREIERGYGWVEPLPSVHASYGQLAAIGRDLQRTLAVAPEAWGELHITLSGASEVVQDIQAELDALAVLIEGRAAASGRLTEKTVRQMANAAILFAMAIVLIAVFVGYYVSAYLRESAERRRLAVFAERNPNPVMRLKLSGEIIYANAAANELARRMGADSVRVLLPVDLSERLTALRTADDERYDVWQYQREARALECGIHYLPDLASFHAYVADATERRLNEEKLVFHAYHHPLTGLPNRRMFQEVIEQTLAEPEHSGLQAAVFLLGMDRFKVVVDTLGHAVGDQLLQAVAARLSTLIHGYREMCGNCTLHHFEGDLFAVLGPALTSDKAPALIAEKLLNGLAEPLYVAGREFSLSFSIGIAVFPVDGKDALTLLKNADSAMHGVKRHGGHGFRMYKPEMNAFAEELLQLESYLRHAIERDELRLHYQPQVNVHTGEVTALEALLRWEHPQRGLLEPKDFIALAEESGMIVPIGEWVLRSACRQNRAWRDHGRIRTAVAVNISARQFHQQDLPQLVGTVLADTGLPADALELEITESVAMHDVERTVAMLQELKNMGVRLAIDDFGTGFSSLAYLKRFPIDKLKVDQSFVHHMTTDGNDAAIARAIVTLGHAMKLTVCAEGVETPEQLSRLRQYDCDEAQGLLYSPPVPAHNVETLLGTHKRLVGV